MTFLGINDAIETGKKLISSRFNYCSRYYIASAYQTVADTKNNYFYSFLKHTSHEFTLWAKATYGENVFCPKTIYDLESNFLTIM